MLRSIVLMALTACAGTATKSSEPASTVLNESVTPEVSSSSENQPDENVPASTIPGEGFWCARFYPSSESVDYLGACYRVKSTCNTLRGKAIKVGQHVTECTNTQNALCFTMTDMPRQQVNWRCYDSEYRCSVERQKFQRENAEAKLDFSKCQLTAQTSYLSVERG